MPTSAVFTRTTPGGAAQRGTTVLTQHVPEGVDSKITVTDMTLPDPYVTGGITLTAANLGLTTLYAILSVIVTAPIDGTVTAGLDAADLTQLWVAVEDGTSGVSAEHAGSSAVTLKVRIVALGV